VKLDVLPAVHLIADAGRLITPTTIKNCVVTCGFSIDLVSSTDDSAVKLCEDEEDDWHSVQSLGVQFEDHVTVPEKEEEVAENKASFLDALKGAEAARIILL
jgi:hypothetical protein